MLEFKKLAQPLAVSLVDEDSLQFTVRSKRDFCSLDHLAGKWSLVGDGTILADGELDLSGIPAGESRSYSLDELASQIEEFSGESLGLSFSFTTKEATPLLPEGHEVAWENFPLKALRTVARNSIEGGALKPKQAATGISIEGDGLTLQWSAKTGQLESITQSSGENLLASPVKFTWWRAATVGLRRDS